MTTAAEHPQPNTLRRTPLPTAQRARNQARPSPAGTDSASGPSTPVPRSRTARRVSGILVLTGALLVLAVLSVAVGSRAMGLGEVWDGLTDHASDAYPVVTELRVPRTILGLAAGAAL